MTSDAFFWPQQVTKSTQDNRFYFLIGRAGKSLYIGPKCKEATNWGHMIDHSMAYPTQYAASQEMSIEKYQVRKLK